MAERINQAITAERISLLRSGYRVPFSDHVFLYKVHPVCGSMGIPLMWEEGLPFWEGLEVKGIYSLCRWTNIQDNELVIARCGFNLGDRKLVITHTPQGTDAENLRNLGFSKTASKKALAPLREDFRGEMIQDLVNLAWCLGYDSVIGTPASRHIKVQFGYITESQGKKVMDEPFERIGFRLDSAIGKYVYDLKHTGDSWKKLV